MLLARRLLSDMGDPLRSHWFAIVVIENHTRELNRIVRILITGANGIDFKRRVCPRLRYENVLRNLDDRGLIRFDEGGTNVPCSVGGRASHVAKNVLACHQGNRGGLDVALFECHIPAGHHPLSVCVLQYGLNDVEGTGGRRIVWFRYPIDVLQAGEYVNYTRLLGRIARHIK